MAAPRTADARAALPPALAEALAGYEDHLRTQRDLSEHTVRGYVDRRRMAARPPGPPRRAAGARPRPAPPCAAGSPRAARAGTAARPRPGTRRPPGRFTAWLRRAGLTPEDVGLRLVSPKAHRTLPDVLAPDQARAAVESAARAPRSPSGCGTPSSSSCSTPAASASASSSASTSTTSTAGRRLLRVLGKGRKERSVPYGVPAERGARRLADPRPPRPGHARLRARAAARRPRPAAGRPRGAAHRPRARSPRPPARPTSARTACATPPRRTSWRAAPTSARFRSCWATLASRRPRSTRT